MSDNMNWNDVDYDDVSTSQYDDLNDGIYSVIIETMKLKVFPEEGRPIDVDPSKPIPTDAFVEVAMQVVEGDRKDTKHNELLFLFKSDVSGKIAKGNLLKLAIATGFSKQDLQNMSDVESKLKDKPFKIELKTKTAKNGKAYQNMTDIFDVNGNKAKIPSGNASAPAPAATTTAPASENEDPNKPAWATK